MNPRLWKSFDKLRDSPSTGFDGLVEFFRGESIRFAASDLGTWGQFLATRFGRAGGPLHVPDWLANVFVSLGNDVAPKSICDPWAGVGFLVGALREGCEPEEAFAFTKCQSERDVGEVLLPDVRWEVGDPLQLVSDKAFDLVVSVLPMGVRASKPLALLHPSGETLEVRDDYGNLLMVAASLQLTASGVGLFVVSPSFFFKEHSVFRQLSALGLGAFAALALPAGTFSPYTNIPTYLLITRRQPAAQMFIAQLSADEKTNLLVLDNLRQGQEGGSLELGRFVDPISFKGLEAIRLAERFEAAQSHFGAPSVTIEDLATAINLGRQGEAFAFKAQDNSLFIPIIGNSEVVDSIDGLTLKNQNYAQIIIDPSRSTASFVARFLNSEFGQELRDQSKAGFIPRLNKQSIKGLPVFVPDLQTQQTMLEIEGRITAEENLTLGLQNELREFRRQLWAKPSSAASVDQGLRSLSERLGGGLRKHTEERLESWFETLPFPLASILRAWQSTLSQDFNAKQEHLLQFFEATAQFLSVIFLSAFSSNEAFFGAHKQKLTESMGKQQLSFGRATFGTWKLVVEYLGKQTRSLLSREGKKPEDAESDRLICGELFSDASLALPDALSRKPLAAIFSTTCKMRNDWSGHSGVSARAGEAKLRNDLLLAEVQKLREALEDIWSKVQLVSCLHCVPRRGVFENEVAVLMSSNSEFLKETRSMATWLDVESLYLSSKETGGTLKLLPLIQVGPSPQSAKNACYFFSRLERGGARFVSYHFKDQPELKGEFNKATEVINFLTQT